MCVLTPLLLTWVKFKVFKNGPSKISLSNHFKFFKGYLPQILLGPFLNTFTHTFITLDSWLIWGICQLLFDVVISQDVALIMCYGYIDYLQVNSVKNQPRQFKLNCKYFM